jgi:threonine/homoserine/homoserine lactone efflux protein
MLIGIGTILILFGLASIFWGDKELAAKGGVILRLFSWPRGRARWMKWLIGVALIYAGAMILFRTVGL